MQHRAGSSVGGTYGFDPWRIQNFGSSSASGYKDIRVKEKRVYGFGSGGWHGGDHLSYLTTSSNSYGCASTGWTKPTGAVSNYGVG